MKENKNIERLFQEKLKDFEKEAPEISWDIISSRLNKKEKKRRVLPLWFTFSNIAAGLLLIGFIGWNTFIANETSTIFNDDKKPNQSFDKQLNSNSILVTNDNTQITDSNDSSILSNDDGSTKIERTRKANASVNQNQNVQQNPIKEKILEKEKNKTRITLKNKKQINQSNNLEKNKITKKSATDKFFDNSEIIAANISKNNDKRTNKFNEYDSIFANKDFDTKIAEIFINDNVVKEVQLNDLTSFNDSLLVIALIDEEAIVENPLEKLLKEKELGKNANEKEKTSKWAISSQVSPVYFNAVSGGSSLGEQFVENSKSFVNSTSYGVGASYELSNRLTLRSGVNSLTFGYDTNEVIYDMSLRNIDNSSSYITRSSSSSNVILKSKFSSSGLMTDIENFKEENIGSLRQNISYIEVPMELSYKMLDKKFGISLIGGMSTLFLNNNSVSLIAEGMQMEIGKANNLNELHFSSNVGLGFKYTFWKSFNANFQPMFKYQINPFSENAGNFKPYFIGLYSGISYQF